MEGLSVQRVSEKTCIDLQWQIFLCPKGGGQDGVGNEDGFMRRKIIVDSKIKLLVSLMCCFSHATLNV